MKNNFNLKKLIGTNFTPEDLFIEITTDFMTASELIDFMNSLPKEKIDELYEAIKSWKATKPVSSDELAVKRGARKLSDLISSKLNKRNKKNFSSGFEKLYHTISEMN